MNTFEGIRVIGTYSCKKNCSFCYQKTRSGGFLDPERFRSIISKLDQLPIYFTFQGGELSYFTKETEELIEVANEVFPQVFGKSLTTNGEGSMHFYKGLKRYGITHFSFSLHNTGNVNDSVKNKILELKRDGCFTVRVNCYFDESNLDNIKDVLNFCRKNSVQLTLCEDLRLSSMVGKSNRILSKMIPEYNIQKNKHQDIYWISEWNFRLWVYRHLDHYDYNNLIILPNGETTMTFDDVQKCRGNL